MCTGECQTAGVGGGGAKAGGKAVFVCICVCVCWVDRRSKCCVMTFCGLLLSVCFYVWFKI